MLWQPLYPLLTKEPKSLCFSADENKAKSIQCIAPFDILSTKLGIHEE